MCIVALPAAAAVGPIRWHGTTEVATGHGQRGPWQQNESQYDFVDDPSVGLSDPGEVVIAWVDQKRKDVLFQRYSADGEERYKQPINISRNPATFSWLPRVALGQPGRVFILWQEIIFSGGSHGGEILFARSENDGASFSEPLNLSNSVGGDGKGRVTKEYWDNGSLDIAVSGEGTVYAAWTEYDGMLWLSRSADGGKSFSPARLVFGDKKLPARGPSLALGANHEVYLAWTVGEDMSADIRVAKSVNGGDNFGTPVIVAHSKGYSDAPKLAVDRHGALHVVYGENDGGPFGASHVRYTRSLDGGRTFEAPRVISQPLPASAISSSFPTIALDADQNVYVVWELFEQLRQRPRGQAIAISRDSGSNFTTPQLVPRSVDATGGYNGSQQGLLTQKLDVNSRGSIAIVNSSLKVNERSAVWLVRGAISR